MKLKGHVVEKWQTRTGDPLASRGDVVAAWEGSKKIVSGTVDGGELRFHEDTNSIMVYRNECIRTVLNADWEEFRGMYETGKCESCGEKLEDIETCPQCGQSNPSVLR